MRYYLVGVEKKDEDDPVVVVRLKSTQYQSKRGMESRRTLNFLKRKCRGFNFLQNDVVEVGAEDVMRAITNLNTSDDGVYRVVICNEHRDWETGLIEDWEYKLIPYEEEK